MPIHHVKAGDTIQTIARSHGFRQWRRVFEHPKNAQLRATRPDPEVLAEGDSVFVPEVEPRIDEARVDEQTVFVLAPVRRELVVALQDPSGASLAGTPYTLSVDGVDHEGIVAPSGRVRHDIEVEARQAQLVLEIDEDVSMSTTLQIGALEPVETDEGVRARLYNLGFMHDGPHADGPADLAHAMGQFRDARGLPALDDPLSDKAREDLLFAHGA